MISWPSNNQSISAIPQKRNRFSMRSNLPARRPSAKPMDYIDLSPFAQFGREQPTYETGLWELGTGGEPAAYRAINNIVPMVTVEEDHDDDLVITEHPV